MLTGETPAMNWWNIKKGRRKGNDFHCHIYEELTILKLSTKQFQNDKLLTEPPNLFLTISVELCNLLLYFYFISFQHFKYIFQKINTKFQIT